MEIRIVTPAQKRWASDAQNDDNPFFLR